jgi:uncharacterized repeat protein (TIGR03803 family)
VAAKVARAATEIQMSKLNLWRAVSLVSVFCALAVVGSPAPTFTTLASFNGSDGGEPFSGLVQGFDGKFYGTTLSGGAHDDGTVFKITPTGTLTTLHNFCSQPSCTDGEEPEAGLIQATNGNFYGTTELGGAHGDGTVFEITPTGTLTTLHSFCSQPSCTDGEEPVAGLIQAINGNFYGTTLSGGAHHDGTVFEITPTRILTTLYSFCSQPSCTDGDAPEAGLIQATNGNFYGTTTEGGDAHDDGTVFEITPTRTLTTLYSFCPKFPCTDGVLPFAGLIQATNGDFYGTTHGGGARGDGTVFSLATGLGPFVETLPAVGKVGATVIILGNNLTGASRVTFNGTPATFKVVSDSEITTVVPSGATTGKVAVTTPSGSLTSNVTFSVN